MDELFEIYRRKEAGMGELARRAGMSEVSFRACLVEAGIPINKRGILANRVVSARNRCRNADIVAAVDDGATYQTVADRYGLNSESIHTICSRAGRKPSGGEWVGSRHAAPGMSAFYRREKRLREKASAYAGEPSTD